MCITLRRRPALDDEEPRLPPAVKGLKLLQTGFARRLHGCVSFCLGGPVNRVMQTNRSRSVAAPLAFRASIFAVCSASEWPCTTTKREGRADVASSLSRRYSRAFYWFVLPFQGLERCI